MAFDNVFQGPPEKENAPGTHQSPALGVDVENKALYVSAGDGWEELGGTGTVGLGTQQQFAFYAADGTTVVGNDHIAYDSQTNTVLLGEGVGSFSDSDVTIQCATADQNQSSSLEVNSNAIVMQTSRQGTPGGGQAGDHSVQITAEGNNAASDQGNITLVAHNLVGGGTSGGRIQLQSTGVISLDSSKVKLSQIPGVGTAGVVQADASGNLSVNHQTFTRYGASATWNTGAGLGPTVLFTAPVSGHYSVAFLLDVVSANGTGTFGGKVTFTGDGNTVTKTVGSTVSVDTVGATNNPNIVTEYLDAGTTLSYTITGTSITGTPTVRYAVSVQYIGA